MKDFLGLRWVWSNIIMIMYSRYSLTAWVILDSSLMKSNYPLYMHWNRIFKLYDNINVVNNLLVKTCIVIILLPATVTPFDVVKIRLQMQQKPSKPPSFFLYSNGLMDHLCICSHCNLNGTQKVAAMPEQWFQRPSHFTGMAVCLRLWQSSTVCFY